MNIDSTNILQQIAAQRDCILQSTSAYGREALFSERLNRLCPDGREKIVVELAFVCDCMTAIEAVLFSLNGSPRRHFSELHRFLKTAAKLFSRRDKKLYGEFANLDKKECERFLETHYTDRGLFGGANRRTQWSGFQLSKQLGCVLGSFSPLDSYRGIFESAVMPLLDAGERVEDVLELVGVWTAINKNHGDCQPANHLSGSDRRFVVEQIELADMNNPAILFDVVADNSSTPVVKLNTQHNAFQYGHSFELLLQAWAHMEADAWDKRKQLLEDVRTDWGRVARDLSQNGNGLSR